MSLKLYPESAIQNIASAIRSKNGLSTTYNVNEMASAISNIPSGGPTPSGTLPITSNGTYNVASYASANVNVPTGSGQLTTKTVQPTDEPQTIYGDSADFVSSGGKIVLTDGVFSTNYTFEVNCAYQVWGEVKRNINGGDSFTTLTIPLQYISTQAGSWVASGGNNFIPSKIIANVSTYLWVPNLNTTTKTTTNDLNVYGILNGSIIEVSLYVKKLPGFALTYFASNDMASVLKETLDYSSIQSSDKLIFMGIAGYEDGSTFRYNYLNAVIDWTGQDLTLTPSDLKASYDPGLSDFTSIEVKPSLSADNFVYTTPSINYTNCTYFVVFVQTDDVVYDGMSQVIVNAIPSQYIIPSGTYSVGVNGVYNITSYASVDVNIPGSGSPADLTAGLFMRNRGIIALTSESEPFVSGSLLYCPQAFFDGFVTIPEYTFYYTLFTPSTQTFTFNNAISISANAFNRASSLTPASSYCRYSFNFPEATTIGEQAFYGHRFAHFSGPKVATLSSGAFSSCWYISSIYLPECTSVGNYAFYWNSSLTSVSLPKCETLGNYAFASCSNITRIELPSCTSIGSYAFMSCTNLSSISFPICQTIGNNAFSNLSKISIANFPSCTSVGGGAFNNCSTLATLSFSLCTTLGMNAFNSCKAIVEASFPACTSISTSTFAYCSSMTSITLSNLTTVPSNAFASCYKLTTVVGISACTTVGSNAFFRCSSLTTIDLPSCATLFTSAFNQCITLSSISLPICNTIHSLALSACYLLSTLSLPNATSISASAFAGCRTLLSLYLMGSSLCSLSNINAFTSTPISTYTTYTGGVNGSIYVPASLYDSYIAATNWITYSDRFVSV